MLANESDMVPQPRHIMVQNLHIRAGRNDEGELSASVQNLGFRPHPALCRGNAGLTTTTSAVTSEYGHPIGHNGPGTRAEQGRNVPKRRVPGDVSYPVTRDAVLVRQL